jgi:hypothetical protein
MSLFKGPVSGLYTSPNPFENTPPGSCSRADNVIFDAPGVLAPRRGYDLFSRFGFTTADKATSIANCGTNLITHSTTSGGRVDFFNADTMVRTSLGYYNPYSNTTGRMRFVQAQNNTYFNSSVGIKSAQGLTGVPSVVSSGLPAGLSQTSILGHPTNGWLEYGTAVAYRYELATKDSYGRVLVSAPSGRSVASNNLTIGIGGMSRVIGIVIVSGVTHAFSPGDTFTLTENEADFPAGTYTVATTPLYNQFTYVQAGANVSNTIVHGISVFRTTDIRAQLPFEATTSMFLRLYRSNAVLANPDGSFSPSDDMYQVYESPLLTAGDLATGYLQFTDITPEIMLRDPIDTSPNFGDGILQANYTAPVCTDMAYWNDRMWYANTTSKQRLTIQLIGTGSTSFTTTSTITIDGHVFTGSSDFYVQTGLDAATNIYQTALSFCNKVNSTAGLRFYCYYVSGENDSPGKILIEERAIGGAVIPVLSSAGLAFEPTLSATVPVNTNVDRGLNRIFYSKLEIPEGVPLVNYLPIDSANKAILRIIPYNNKLYVFKEDGIWFVSQSYPYQVQQVSPAILVGIDSVAVMGERIWCLTNQGIVTISDGGVTVISVPIEADLMSRFGSTLANLKTMSFGIGYESDRKYILWLPTDSTSTGNTEAFVYSQLSNGFTKYTFGAQCAVIRPTNDSLYLGSPDFLGVFKGEVFKERKTRTSADFLDREYEQRGVLSKSGNVLTLTTSQYLKAGDCVLDAQGNYQLITDVDPDGYRITMLTSDYIPSGTYYRFFQCFTSGVSFNPITGNDPGVMKRYTQCSFLFSKTEPRVMSSLFSNEIVQSESEIPLTFQKYGLGTYGEGIYGDPVEKIRRIAPLESDKSVCSQLSVGLNITEGARDWKLLGYAVEYTGDTEKNRG